MPSKYAETTGLIIIGASEWPKVGLENEIAESNTAAFKNSADAVCQYFLNSNGFGLLEKNILNLFDTSHPASQTALEITLFIKNNTKTLTDIILYYVGHGTFVGNEYVLLLRDTHKDNVFATGLTAKSISQCFLGHGRNLRSFVILDCCFSASAVKEFQGPETIAMVKSTARECDAVERGIAILCASSRDLPAKLGQKNTLFTEAFCLALNKGDQSSDEDLSIADVYTLIRIHLRRTQENPVLPEIHYSKQTDGTLASVKIFPNQSKAVSARSFSRQEDASVGQKSIDYTLKNQFLRLFIPALLLISPILITLFITMSHSTNKFSWWDHFFSHFRTGLYYSTSLLVFSLYFLSQRFWRFRWFVETKGHCFTVVNRALYCALYVDDKFIDKRYQALHADLRGDIFIDGHHREVRAKVRQGLFGHRIRVYLFLDREQVGGDDI